MTLKQLATFDMNRILVWDVGRALTTPVRNPLLKGAFGWAAGVPLFALASAELH